MKKSNLTHEVLMVTVEMLCFSRGWRMEFRVEVC